MRWIDAAEVGRRLSYDACIAAMRDALVAFSRGDAVQPLRTALRLPGDGGAMYVMPAWTAAPPALTVKLITAFEGNAASGRATHNGVIVAFDTDTGVVRAVIDAAAVTAIRTAAVSAVATDLLARDDAATLALLGAGVQATSHLRAMLKVRAIRSVRVWSRGAARAESFVREHADAGPTLVAERDAQSAVRDAAIICTVTSAREPVLRREWVADGSHINAVGASLPSARELDGELVASASIWVDSHEAARAEAGDLLIARTDGLIDDESIVGELGAALAGSVRGRTSASEITLFKSLGLAVEDAAAASVVLDG